MSLAERVRRISLPAIVCILTWLVLLGLARDGAYAHWPRDEGNLLLQQSEATLSLPEVTVAPGQQVTVPLTLALTQGQVYSADITLTYDSAVADAVSVEKGTVVGPWSLASNLATPGVIRAALAGAEPITAGGELLLIVFQAVGEVGTITALTLTTGDLNEGSIPASLESGQMTIASPDSTPTATHTPTSIPTATNTPTPSAGVALSSGWNLVSVSRHPGDTSLTAVLSTIEGKYDLVYAYHASDAADPWKKYNTAAPSFLNDLTDIDETMGLWIRATEPVTLTVSGSVPSSTDISLYTGWNLVGYPSQTTRPIAEALAGIEGKYDLVYAYDAWDAEDPWKKYNTAAPPFLNDLTEMGPGWGYWIRVSEDCVWSVP